MTDVALMWNVADADLGVVGGDLAVDEGLRTAIILSLFTDRRADDADTLPDGATDRRGWFGDALAEVPGDRIGSKLWLIAREKQEQAIVDRAATYARQALQWLLDDKVTDHLDVTAEIVRTGWLGIGVAVWRPNGNPVEFRFDYNWRAEEARI